MSSRRRQTETATPEESRALLAAELSEKQFQANVVRYAVEMGWKVYYDTVAYRSPEGWCDLYMVRGCRSVVAELKAMRNKGLTEDQKAWLAAHAATKKTEIYIWLPDRWEEIEEVLGR